MKKKAKFNDLINGDRPVLLDFYAEWCGPCKAMAPILREVAKEIGDQASIVKIDVDKHAKLSQKLGIKGVPTFIIYRKGEIRWQQSGMQSAGALSRILRKVVTKQL